MKGWGRVAGKLFKRGGLIWVHVKIKYYEWVRHGITEPLLKVQIFKKVEDGKVVAMYDIMYYSNKLITAYENSTLDGPVIVEENDEANLANVLKLIKKYYDEANDDLIIRGERYLGEKLIELIALEESE